MWYAIPAILSVVVILAAIIASKMTTDPSINPMAGTEAPSLRPFDNPITFSILMLCVGLISIGVIMAAVGSFWGIIIGGIGAGIWIAGDTDHPVNPRTAGMLTFWDAPICIGGAPVVVGGRTILANYWPFFLSSTPLVTINQDRDFPVPIVTKDNVNMPGFISVTLQPDVTDLVDYLQAGAKMEAIFSQIDDIISEKAKDEGRRHDSDDVAKQNSLISKPLRAHLGTIFEEKSFGIKIKKVQARYDMPPEIIQAINLERKANYDRAGQLAEYETDITSAEKLFAAYQKAGTPQTMDKCLQEIKQLRLIRDGKNYRFDGNGVVLTDAKLDLGSKSKTK